MEYEAVARTPEMGPGQLREVLAHGETLALVNVGQTYYALSAHCPNDGVNLAREGELRGDHLICPGDGLEFDVRTGERVGDPDAPGLRRYPIMVANNEVRVGSTAERRDAA